MTGTEFAGQRVLVTGASRGIGAAIAVGFASEGADIVSVASSHESALSIEERVTSHGGAFRAVGVDLADRSAVTAFTADELANHGAPDVLVMAAGIARRAPAAEYSDSDWDEVLAVNLDATFLLMRDLGAAMVERGSGSIIAIASMLSFQGGLRVPAYAASKGAVASLVKSFANEWASLGVGVNAIAPGYIATEMNTALINDETRNRQVMERIPAGRWGQADDIAGAALFLASERARYVHGAVIPVDGGWLGR